jgi:hypothetical protein
MAKRIVWTDQAKADIRGIEQPVAIQILKTLGRYLLSGEGSTKQLQGVAPPMIRLRAQKHRVFCRDKGTYIEIDRVLDRKDAYR